MSGNGKTISQDRVREALKHLRRVDPVIAQVMQQVGSFTLKLERNRFRMLVRSIISQQISTQAARSIRLRFEELLAPKKVTATNILGLSVELIRSAGLSSRKVTYLFDLAEKVQSGQVHLSRVGRMSDVGVIDELVQVKGVGRWTAQMFLIFCLGRLNVFPDNDLGIRVALQKLYGLQELPNKATSQKIATVWEPYSTVASWYCWRSGDLSRSRKNETTGYPV